MSHFACLVVMPNDARLDPSTEEGRRAMEEKASELLAPYDEKGEWNREGSRWDWWAVGGRWTGDLDGHDPYAGDANWNRCELCQGTGTRTMPIPKDADSLYAAIGATFKASDWHPVKGECNGCGGAKGERPGWQKAWSPRPYDGDYNRVSAAIARDFIPYAVLTQEDGWIGRGRMGWWGISVKDEEGVEAQSKEDWARFVRTIYGRYKDRACVLVDCHV